MKGDAGQERSTSCGGGSSSEADNAREEAEGAREGGGDVGKAEPHSGGTPVSSGAESGIGAESEEVRRALSELVDSLGELNAVLHMALSVLEIEARRRKAMGNQGGGQTERSRAPDLQGRRRQEGKEGASEHVRPASSEIGAGLSAYEEAGAPFGAGWQARGIWRLFQQRTTRN